MMPDSGPEILGAETRAFHEAIASFIARAATPPADFADPSESAPWDGGAERDCRCPDIDEA
jgi:hypothetical protein